MSDGFAWWLLIAGITIGIGLAWLIVGRLARADDDVGEEERAEEAAWISRSIEQYGGVAPTQLVDEVLDLHRRYLEGPGLEPSGSPSVDEPDEEEGEDEALAMPAPIEPRTRTPTRASGQG